MGRIRAKPHLRKDGTLVVPGRRAASGRGVSVYNGVYKRKRRGKHRRR